MRYPLATDLKVRTAAPDKDARQTNAYIEVNGDQSVVRKRPSAQGGVSIGSGVAQGGIGLNIAGVDYIYTVNGDTGALDTLATAGTTWSSGSSYSVGGHVSSGFVDYWALTNHSGSQPPSANWSESYVPAEPPPPTVYATWNPADKVGVTLSNGDLTAYTTQGTVRSMIGKSSGKWYWEYNITQTEPQPETLQTYGVAKIYAYMGNEVGNDANGYGYGNKNDYTPTIGIKRNSTSTNYGSELGTSCVVGVALNMDAGTIEFYLDGVSQGAAFSGLSGTLYASVGMQTQVSSDFTVTANFGASAFTYSVPSGYNSGLYT